MTDKEIARINELAHIKKERELTAEEAQEQLVLRKKFIADFKANVKSQLDNIEIVDPDDPRLKNKIKN